MTLPFKKKKNEQPALYTSLEIALEEAKTNKKTYFYLPLLDGEEHIAHSWAVRHRLWMEKSHKNGNTLVYKFSGIKEQKQ